MLNDERVVVGIYTDPSADGASATKVRVARGADPSAVALLRSAGLTLLPSRYAVGEGREMVEAVFEVELAHDEQFGTSYEAESDTFLVLGHVDPAKLRAVLDGHYFEYREAEGGRETSG